jgi:hypothetical protein
VDLSDLKTSGTSRPACILFLILLLLVPSGILAGGKTPDEEQPSDGVFSQAKLWIWVVSGWGGGGFGFGADNYLWAIAGGSVGVKLADIYLVEGGGSWLFGTSWPSFEAFLRGGIEFELWDARGSNGRGWRLRWPALVGYRYVRFGGEADGRAISEGSHCVTLNTGFEIMRHASNGSGVGLRLLVGGSLPFSQQDYGWTGDYSGKSVTTFILDTYLALVLAF